MTSVLAIDPGSAESAFARVDVDTCEPLSIGKLRNGLLAEWLRQDSPMVKADTVAIEMVASYGMPVGADVFETCVWIGVFSECVAADPQLVYRRDVKLHHCHTSKAKDTNVRQALVDRFAPGEPNHGKGTKADPGWFHGFAADVWQAYALGVRQADLIAGRAA